MNKNYKIQRPLNIGLALKLLADSEDHTISDCRFRSHKGSFTLRKETLVGVSNSAVGGPTAFYDRAGSQYYYCELVQTIDTSLDEDGNEMPEPWLAYIPKLEVLTRPELLDLEADGAVWWLYCGIQWENDGGAGYCFNLDDESMWAVDVRTEFARKHFPELVAAHKYDGYDIEPDSDDVAGYKITDLDIHEIEARIGCMSLLWHDIDPKLIVKGILQHYSH